MDYLPHKQNIWRFAKSTTLEKEIADTELHSAPLGQLNGTEGRLSRQDSLMHHEIAKEAQRRRQMRLKHLRGAVQKIDIGEFGFCANCKSEIEFSREPFINNPKLAKPVPRGGGCGKVCS